MEDINHNFGKVAENTIVKHTFDFPQKITNVSCGCGCTTANRTDKQVTLSWDVKTIPAGVLKNGKDEFMSKKTCTITFADKSTIKTSVTATVCKTINT